MPEYTGIKQYGQLLYDDFPSRRRYIAKIKDGMRFRENLRKVAAKSGPQLGYYWGLLLPEIHKQHLRDGVTVSTIYLGKVCERQPTILESHELIKDFCGLVGDDGVRLNVEDMDEYTMFKFLDNVLYHATFNLKMDGEKLEAKRPELRTASCFPEQ